MDLFSQLGVDWGMDQSSDYFPFDDLNFIKAEDGLPGNSIKPETLADTPMEELLELCNYPNEDSFGAPWMEQTDFPYPPTTSLLDLPLPGEDLFPSSTTVTTTTGPVKLEERKEELFSSGHVFADEFLHNLNNAPVKLETPPSSPPVEQVTPEIILEADAKSSVLVLENGTIEIEFLQSPLSSDDVESVLSSASSLPTSPTPVPTPSPSPSPTTTVDTSVLYTDNGSWSFSSSELYKVVENTDKARPTPYSRPSKTPKTSKPKGRKQTASIGPSPSELEWELMSKKDRKKQQNKNAAIRYRQKKKKESDQQKTEEQELESMNQSLRTKCEELQREVKTMKDLINEIRKAQGKPPLALSQSSLLAMSK